MRILILFSMLLLLCNCNIHKKSTEQELLLILKSFNLKIQDNTVYLLIPSNTCYGCRRKTIDTLSQLSSIKKLNIIVITSDISLLTYNKLPYKMILDTHHIVDRSRYFKEKITLYQPNKQECSIKQFEQYSIDSIYIYLR
ncbi:MAG: hypothetical protein N3F62_06040 [Bacteroidia bacterium]|nr:hypothetical protein [Bacteroidia bacterium]